MPTVEEKRASLRSAILAQVQVVQVVAVFWNSPDGTKFYSHSQIDDITPFRGVTVALQTKLSLEDVPEIEPRLLGEAFTSFDLSPDMSDEEINLNFADSDLEMQRLFSVHGEGVRVEIFYYYPQVELIESKWFGQLSTPENGTYISYTSKASSGLSSRLSPIPRRNFQEPCPRIFGGLLATQAEIDASGCPYNRHIGGSVGTLHLGVPHAYCAHDLTDCQIRLEDTLSYGGFSVNASPIVSDKSGTLAGSRGNTSNLKRPLRVVLGYKHIRDLDLLVWRREPNPTTPDKGFVSAIYAISEGTISSAFGFKINDGTVNIQASNIRLGQFRQPPTSYAPDISNFSGTSLIFTRAGWVNANTIDVPGFQTFIAVHGIDSVRQYTDSDSFFTGVNDNPAWNILECYTNRIWGRAYDYSRFQIEDWITVANEQDTYVIHTDPSSGVERIAERGRLSVDLQGRVAQDQITDLCRSQRISPPFQFDGKYTIRSLIKWDDLGTCREFTDSGDDKNILTDKGIPLISYSQASDKELPNEIVLVFEDAVLLDIERPLTFIDEQQQIKAGKAFGDNSLRPIQKRFSAFGIREYIQAVRLGWSLLHLGEFDSGGLRNNLRITFTTSHTQVLGMKKYDVIKVTSRLIEVFGFQYFRVLSVKQMSNLDVVITAQAYPEDYYETFEDTPEEDPDPEYGGLSPAPDPVAPVFTSVIFDRGLLQISVENV